MPKKTTIYPEAAQAPNFPSIEEAILQRWERNRTFEKQIALRPTLNADGRSNEFVFFDGPPFANGMPHYGHSATGFVKDIIPRFQTMRGRHVKRRFGWDCHGLPAELEVEKDIQVFGRKSILDYGIDKFNEKCRSSVQRYAREWERYVKRQARWVSFEDGYRTMDKTFMESVIWAFKSLWEKGLIYEGHRVVPYSWKVQTALSNFETRLDNSYRERTDPALTVSFHMDAQSDDPGPMRIMAWTTTPWTLPSNLALAVNPVLTYVAVEKDGEYWIMAEAALERYQREFPEVRVAATFGGEQLVGRTYTPMFPYFADVERAFCVLPGGFVDANQGTGVVHVSPGFGEDDLAVCQAAGIPVVVPVDEAGCFTAPVTDYLGQNVIYEGNESIIRDLKLRRDGTLVRHDQIIHSYPHCWRTDEPLIYKAIDGWYIAVSQFKDRMVELNQGVNWIPFHVRDGGFGKWLENARDWNISRNRFWGTPIPVWKSDDPAYPRLDVYGSMAELERDFGVGVDDIHRPAIDTLTRPNPDDPTGRSTMRRVPEVLDCWFESGSMPFAQQHYPFENKDRFDKNFPGDFVVEYVAQTRGWFYTMMVISTALFDRAPFRNCICHGVVLDENYQKLSKRLKNYPDPIEVFNTSGADALRWYMMSSPLMIGGDLAMAKNAKSITKATRPVILRLWNAYVFFTLYANIDGLKAKIATESENLLDRYILAKTRNLVNAIEAKLEAFDIPGAYEQVNPHIEALNNWYIRNRRSAFWSNNGTEDKRAAYDTLYTCLTITCRAVAPLMPMIAEEIYTSLTGEESVHLSDWPNINELPRDENLVYEMDLIRSACSAVLTVREESRRRVRLPLSQLTIAHPESAALARFKDVIANEVNVKVVNLTTDLLQFGTREIRVDPSLGKSLGSKMKEVFVAQKDGDWRQRDDGVVEIAGIELMPNQYEIRVKPIENLASKPFDQGRGVVVLDTLITKELQAEGWARDMVRLIQSARKDAGFELTDRIAVEIATASDLLAAIELYSDVIMAETLASKLTVSLTMPKTLGKVVSEALDGQLVHFALERI